MITKVLSKVFGTKNDRELKKLQPLVDHINSLEPSMKALSDDELSSKTDYFKDQLDKGKTLDDILPEAFAVVREAALRKLQQRHYDVQLIGGIVLHQGKIAEMKTGEGKTLTSTLAVYLNALTGKCVHIVTVNDYLARRDAEWMEPLYDFLGLTVGVLQSDITDEDRKDAYQRDILYATNNELGFDYLRDNMKFRKEDYVQRDLNYAIVDEVDSILIDEARTPLIISGPSDDEGGMYDKADKAVRTLSSKPKEDYEVDEKAKSVQMTEPGIDKIEEFFKIDNLYDSDNIKLLHHVNQALKAHTLFKKDVDYVARDNQILIVDEFTGRILSGRRYSDGLHQALEAKEGVKVQKETQTLASITLQNYFRLYNKLAGMTGTALTEAEEFHNIYHLDVVSIPTNRPMIRIDQSDLIFLSQTAKYKAIAEDVKRRYKKGQPVLVGTVAIEQSELLSNVLKSHGIPHEVLNAKQHEREADIVAHAGEAGKITIATNMAGRGTDIKLTPEAKERGGLYILGTERHESRRIDNQLRGRSGRQGDPGESRFYISLEDNLIRIFAGDSMKKYMQYAGMTEEENVDSPFISKRIERSQEKVEKHNFEIRKHLLEYDDVLNQQRTVVYEYRKQFLEGGNKDTVTIVCDIVCQAVNDLVYHNVPTQTITQERIQEVIKAVSQITGIDEQEFKDLGILSMTSPDKIIDSITGFLVDHYKEIIENSDKDMLIDAHKWIMLDAIDHAWKQHMFNLEHLKEGIGLRGWGQKNPLIEYKREAFAMFQEMMQDVNYEILRNVFRLNIHHFNQAERERERQKELDALNTRGPSEDGQNQPEPAQSNKVGRNEDCPCESGKKYKKCCDK
jgi:preprotein translocase subunit SecA